jgi:uncharacterized OsmC-like protein/alpha-beta hydrolase superfamily lysophospholipase
MNKHGTRLSATMDNLDRGEPRAYALFAHCFTCTRNLSAVRRISRGLTEAGLAVLSFDFTGLGGSEGEFVDSTFSSQVDDLVAAAEYLEDEYGEGPTLMMGHSLGGTATLYAAREIDSVRGVVTIGAPADPVHVERLFDCELEEIERTGRAVVTLGGRSFSIDKRFVEDIRSYPPHTWLPDLKINLLIFHSPVDTIVDIKNAQDIYSTVKHPKSFVSLDQADHLLSDVTDARHVARVTAAWADSFLPDRDEEIATPDESWSEVTFLDPDSNFTVAAKIERPRYRVALSNRRHHVVADEPENVGGGDLGGGPFDYLLWSLAACTVMTVRMYGDRMKWDISEIIAQLSLDRVKAESLGIDPKLATQSKGLATVISIQLDIEGDLDDDQRARCLEIAERCPVHRTLVGPVIVNVTGH